MAKPGRGAAGLQDQFRNGTLKKTYQALVEGEIEPLSGRLVHGLTKNQTDKKAETSEDGDISELAYETIKTSNHYSLLKIELKTGRFHQIRVQLSAIGHPIVGDSKYGSKIKYKDGQIALSAVGLAFKTATTDEIKNIKIDYPKEFEVELQSSTSKTLLKQKPPKGPRMF